VEKTVENVKHLSPFSTKTGGDPTYFPPIFTPTVEILCGKVGVLVENPQNGEFFVIFLHNAEKTRKICYFLCKFCY